MTVGHDGLIRFYRFDPWSRLKGLLQSQCWQVGQKWVLRPPTTMRLIGVLQMRQGWPVRE
jgi:hypothetical protein